MVSKYSRLNVWRWMAALLWAMFMLAPGCRKAEPMKIPLPVAYPRPALPDTALVELVDAPLNFAVNGQAAVSSVRPGWYDVAYPTLGATMHLTFTRATGLDLDKARENRMQRLLLNAGEGETAFSEFENAAGFDVLIARTEGSATPLQFLATDGREWLVSGSVYFASPRAPLAIDSLRPMVRAIDRDLTRALESLSR